MNTVPQDMDYEITGRQAGPAGRSTVSIVIPVKNDGPLLARCLAALKAQTRAADEIVVVDNASTDDSAQVARDAGAAVVACPEPGIPAASAAGYDHARCEIILRLDADCVPPATWVEDMVDAFARNPGTAALTGPARFTDGPRALRAPLAAVYLGVYVLATAPALGHRPLFGSNMGLRREAWAQIRTAAHRRDPELHDDLDLAFHLGANHKVGYVKSSMMGVSMRPFFDARAFAKRLRRGFRTVLVHWPDEFPPRRWKRLLGVDRGNHPRDTRNASGSRIA